MQQAAHATFNMQHARTIKFCCSWQWTWKPLSITTKKLTCDTHPHTHTYEYSYQHFIIAVQLSIKNNSIENFIYFFHFFTFCFLFLCFFFGTATWKISHARWGDIFHGEGSVNLLACSPLDSKTSINSHTWTATTIRVVFSEFN